MIWDKTKIFIHPKLWQYKKWFDLLFVSSSVSGAYGKTCHFVAVSVNFYTRKKLYTIKV